MARRFNMSQGPKHSLSPEEAEQLFAKVDNSGHTNEGSAERQRKRRKEVGHGVDVDPLTPDDPSGSNVGSIIQKAAIALVIAFIGAIIFMQVYVSHARATNTAYLSNNVSVRSVADALDGGVEWAGGFTQFPPDFSVQEADETTGRIEVSVVDTTSPNALTCFSSAQIQATAFSVNSLLNPDIDTVIYHVNVHMNEEGDIQRSSFFGFFSPTGDIKPFITFVWTKVTTSDRQVRLTCTISGVDAELQDTLRDQILQHAPEVEDKVVSPVREMPPGH